MAAIEDLKPGGPQFYKISVFRKLAWQYACMAQKYVIQ